MKTPKANQHSVTVRPLFGKARHRQVVKQLWAAERHDVKGAVPKLPVTRQGGKRGR